MHVRSSGVPICGQDRVKSVMREHKRYSRLQLAHISIERRFENDIPTFRYRCHVVVALGMNTPMPELPTGNGSYANDRTGDRANVTGPMWTPL